MITQSGLDAAIEELKHNRECQERADSIQEIKDELFSMFQQQTVVVDKVIELMLEAAEKYEHYFHVLDGVMSPLRGKLLVQRYGRTLAELDSYYGDGGWELLTLLINDKIHEMVVIKASTTPIEIDL